VFNYFKVIFRYPSRSLFFAVLNIAGLSIGLACCIMVFLFIGNELSFDKFQKNGETIYRVIHQSQINGMPYE
jgi:putative ABC transport system permease protein